MDVLLKQALSSYEPHELDYPILFAYRQAVEVKAMPDLFRYGGGELGINFHRLKVVVGRLCEAFEPLQGR